MPKPVLITGCSSGIGLATVQHLAERGAPVYATVRSDADADRVGAIDGVEAFLCDVTRDTDVRRLREQLIDRGAGLWGVVHNAGIGYVGRPHETPLDHVRQVFEVNVFGMHRVTNAVVDLIRESSGRIVTMSSISGTLSSAHMGAYAMSKHAVESYADSLAKALASDGVHVAAVAPGNFASAIAKNAVARFTAPEDAPPEIREMFSPDADLSLSWLPGPEPVAEAVHAALFDDDPRERYLVVGAEEEAERTLEQAALEWARLNASTPHAWTAERLLDAVAWALAEPDTEA